MEPKQQEIPNLLKTKQVSKQAFLSQELKEEVVSKQVRSYKFYKKQTVDRFGRYQLRFQTMLNSPINYSALTQIKHAATFQFKKSWIHLTTKKKKVLQTEKQVNFISRPNQIKMTWLGHATVLLSIDANTHIIIDPIFEERVVPYIGEKRHIPSPCQANQLPKIDYVLISHDHYDHCNSKSLEDIFKLNPQNTVFIAGKNHKDVLPKNCILTQLSWTQSFQFNKNNKKIKITFVPACHWSKRGLYDQNQRLWGGFVIQTLSKKIYFAGDTGYCDLFNQLYQQFQGFDLSLLPIGAYEPNEFLKSQHINPKQAVQIHNQIRSKKSVGIHWGTFPMSHETPEQVLNDLQIALDNIKGGEFITLKIGGSTTISALDQNNYQQEEQYDKKINTI